MRMAHAKGAELAGWRMAGACGSCKTVAGAGLASVMFLESESHGNLRAYVLFVDSQFNERFLGCVCILLLSLDSLRADDRAKTRQLCLE